MFSKVGRLLTYLRVLAMKFQIAWWADRSNFWKSFEYGIKGELIFPRVISLSHQEKNSAYFRTKNQMSLGFEYLSRGGLYD